MTVKFWVVMSSMVEALSVDGIERAIRQFPQDFFLPKFTVSLFATRHNDSP